MTITQEEAFARIRLLRSTNVGPVTFRQLLMRFGNAVAALEALPDMTARGGRKQEVADAGRVRAEVAAVRAAGARYLFHDDPAYPALLNEAPGSPPIVTYRGDVAMLAKPAVAIVGARNASAAALKLARRFGEELAQQGRLVVSGLARGIDAAAHEGALSTGATAGVIAGGIDVTYPPEHAELQERIASEGVLIAEQPPGVEPQARHFPGRNRIIAGLCAGTLVVEAAPKSGSLITARLAGEANREVMAVPGNPLDGRARGCNQLIRDGAVLVQTADDIAELLDGFTGAPRSTFREEPAHFDLMPPELVEAEPADVAVLLSTAPVPVDDIVRASGESTAAVQLALLELELAGRLVRHAGGRVSLA
ncbi:DNA-processing protein DprA [Croceicoccus naphthovorans]|uniref:DNA processing protein DprA n=1 Tax=Croceicoccus naphthovorans TaxID=1348774 RepID=A0A0G3XII2_9SPHN|nr:DNA-processing protein DprA [Croceicoccus naphthovorans]AKM10426.1 DNA processing protein DprA [Croceicoccus naphthovorans]MBB3990135.1 DNA processing protein [Croceicoccus naphthovorans]